MVAMTPLDRRAARSEVEIDAPVERVWGALTDPIELARWLPLDAEVRPGESGALLFRWGAGRCDRMGVTTWDPPHHLVLVPETAEGEPELLTALRLRGSNGRTHLRVETTGFPPDKDWDDLVFSSGLAYRFLMLQLRYYLQRHAGEDRSVLSLHHRVSGDREDAWKHLQDSELLGLPVQRILDVHEGWQIAATTASPGGLMRLAVDPIRGALGKWEVSLWLSVWGAGADQLEAAESVAREALGRQFDPVPPARRNGGRQPRRPPGPFLAYNVPPAAAV